MSERAPIHLGTSAFTASGWAGTFYPENAKPAEYLTYYAEQFDTVEVDSTFYRAPSESTVRGWYQKTPANFVFAAKVPQEITHEKVLVDCTAELNRFLGAMDQLREKLGPLLFQFPYFNRAKFKSGAEFLALLEPFLETLPRGYRFAVEIRNKAWLDNRLLDMLRRRGVALALIDHPWLPRPSELLRRIDPITADFTYIRWLGDRKAIEELPQPTMPFPQGPLLAVPLRYPEVRDPNRLSELLEESILWQVPRVDRSLWMLDTIITLAPLPGLLRTIIRNFNAVQVLGSAGGGAPPGVSYNEV